MSQPLTLTLTRKTPRLSISLGILITLLLLALPEQPAATAEAGTGQPQGDAEQDQPDEHQMLSSSDHSSSVISLSSSTRISSSPFLLHTPWMNLADSSLPTFGAVSISDCRR